MALSDDDKKEIQSLFSDSVAEGLKKFRSFMEEEEAKAKTPPTTEPGKEENSGNSGFSLGSFFLGGNGK